MSIKSDVFNYLNKIRSQSPVIHNITNFVVMSSSANILLALGASPVMSHCDIEVEEMVSISGGLVLNIGTLDEIWIEAMIKAAKTANRLGIPVILDAVGAGSTKLRTKSVHRIMNRCTISVLRGNASEISAISSSGFCIKTKGVDSKLKVNDELIEATKEVAVSNNCVVAISGIKDVITDGISTTYVFNGHPIMTKVTGMGCGLTAFMGAFCAVENNNDIYHATAAASILYNICGELASKDCGNKPGSFFTKFLDIIYMAEIINLPKLARVKVG